MNNSTIGYIIHETSVTTGSHSIIREETEKKYGKDNPPRLVGEGVLQTGDVQNRNGRIYQSKILIPAIVNSPRTHELIKTGTLRSEVGHPLSTDLTRQNTIDKTRCSAKFLKIWSPNGRDIHGQYKGTFNKHGDEFDMDLRDGVIPAWSLRCIGRMEQTNLGAEVVELNFVTYDDVIYPSHKEAYHSKIVSESANGLIPVNIDDIVTILKKDSTNFNTIKESYDILLAELSYRDNSISIKTKTGDTIYVHLENTTRNSLANYMYEMKR